MLALVMFGAGIVVRERVYRWVGLGVLALLQITVWGGGLFLFSGGSLSGLSALGLSAGFFVWALLYFILGYLVYASMLGALGALAPSTREGTQFTFLILLPLFIPLMLSSALIETPNGSLTTFLSLFPLTSPVTMITRLASGNVPIEQLLLGLVLLAITTYGIIVFSARFFRAMRTFFLRLASSILSLSWRSEPLSDSVSALCFTQVSCSCWAPCIASL